MAVVNFIGQISSIALKAGIAKLTIETSIEKTKFDVMKTLLDRPLIIGIDDSQSTLVTEEE